MYRQGSALIGSLIGALFCWPMTASADPGGAVAPPHGPMLMLYFSQPLGARMNPVYGLRLEQTAAAVNPGPYAIPAQRSLIDLQVRDLQLHHSADVQVEFGRRLTWSVRRREFELPGVRALRSLDLPRRAN